MTNANDPVTILCIEDEECLLDELEEELLGKGYEVFTARSGQEAEQVLARTTPHLILCDVMLPGKDGFELLSEWRENGTVSDAVAFIFLTGLSHRGANISGLRAGANDFISKPVDLDILHLKIRNTLSFADSMTKYGASPRGRPQIHLSRRERQVLQKIGSGEQTARIATCLGISDHTVNQYIKEIYRKLGLRNRADAARAAVALGLVSSE